VVTINHVFKARLLASRSALPFVLRNKTDAANAQAIWTVAQQTGTCLASIKQPEQQADSLCTASLPTTEISHHAEQ
jgi:hypothetical protein